MGPDMPPSKRHKASPVGPERPPAVGPSRPGPSRAATERSSSSSTVGPSPADGDRQRSDGGRDRRDRDRDRDRTRDRERRGRDRRDRDRDRDSGRERRDRAEPSRAPASNSGGGGSVEVARPPSGPSIGPSRPGPAAPTPQVAPAASAPSVGPSLPPGFQRKKKAAVGPAQPSVVGPARPPPDMLTDYSDYTKPSHHPDQPQVTHQPHQPEEESSDDEGPALADADYDEEEEHARAIRRVEERSKHQKAVLDGTYNEGVTALPDKAKKSFGAGARTFRKAASIAELDSTWTDTPAEKKKRAADRARKAAAGIKEKKKPSGAGPATVTDRDKALTAHVAAYNSIARPVSLMEMHAYTRKNAGPEEKASVRRPFDPTRDLDLQR